MNSQRAFRYIAIRFTALLLSCFCTAGLCAQTDKSPVVWHSSSPKPDRPYEPLAWRNTTDFVPTAARVDDKQESANQPPLVEPLKIQDNTNYSGFAPPKPETDSTETRSEQRYPLFEAQESIPTITEKVKLSSEVPRQAPYPPSDQANEEFWNQFPTTVPGPHGTQCAQGCETPSARWANGFCYAELEMMWLEPAFQSNHGLIIDNAGIGSAIAYEFGMEATPKLSFGFLGNEGRGIEFSTWKYNEFSDILMFTSDGTSIGETIISAGDPANVLTLTASTAGAQILTREQLKMHSNELDFFGERKFGVSRFRGSFGLRHVALRHLLFADYTDSMGCDCVTRGINDLDSIGPKAGVEYFRTIGCSPFELHAGLSTSVLVARRDQFIYQNGVEVFRQVGKVEPLTGLESFIGIRYYRKMGQCRRVFLGATLNSQTWFNGDSGVNTDSDFSLYGFSFNFGLTR